MEESRLSAYFPDAYMRDVIISFPPARKTDDVVIVTILITAPGGEVAGQLYQ